MRRLFVALSSSLAFSLSAQNRLELTVDTIMRGQGLAGWSPRAVRWSPDGKSVYFEWKQYGDPVEEDYDTYVVGRDGKGLRKLSDEEAKDAPPARGALDARPQAGRVRRRRRRLSLDATASAAR